MAISMLSAISFYSRYSAPTVDADGDTIPDAPAPAEPATAVIEPATQAEESSWLDRLVNWLIPDDVAETTAQVSTTSPTAACGLMAESMPHEHADGGADVVEDIDADGDTVPDQPDVEVHDDGDGPDIPEDIQPEDTPPDEVPDEVTDDGPDGEVPGVCDRSPSAFNLESPTNDATGQSVQPLLNWQDSTDPDAGDSISYQIRVCTDPSCGTVLINRSGLTNSQYQVQASEELDFNADYYWRVQAEDTCPTSVDSTPLTHHFRTALPGVCTTFPSVFNLSTPNDGAIGVVTTPTFDWTDSTDPDAGDSVTYRLIVDDNSDFSSPVLDRPGLTASQYTVLSTEALAEGIRYYWKIEATDTCAQTTDSSSTRSFTTLVPCVPHTYFETDFLTGTPSDVMVNSGSISLIEDSARWTFRYEGDVIPTTVGWTDDEPLGWTAPTPEINPVGILHLNSIDTDRIARFSRNPSFSNATGWMVETRMRVVDNTQSNPSGMGCMIDIRDGVRYFTMRFLNTRILHFESSLDYLIDTRADFHTYRVVGQNDDYFVYVDGILRLDGRDALTTTDTANVVRFHDFTSTYDSEALWDYVYYYNGGTSLPFASLGNFISDIIDTGSGTNNVGSGATVSWTENLPAGTDITMEIYAADITTRPGTSCASGLSNSLGEVIPGSCTGRYVWWRANLFPSISRNQTPRLDDVTLAYETCD